MSIYLSIYLSIYPSIYLSPILSYPILSYPILSIYLSLQSIYLSICLSVRPSVRPSVCLSLRWSVCLTVHPSIHPSTSLCTGQHSIVPTTPIHCGDSPFRKQEVIKNAAVFAYPQRTTKGMMEDQLLMEDALRCSPIS